MPNPDESRRLTPPQETALLRLLSGDNHRQAADAAGVQRTTVSAWMQPGHAVQVEYGRRVEQTHAEIRAAHLRTAEIGAAARLTLISGLLDDFAATDDPKVRVALASAVDRLTASGEDRAGHPSTNRVEVPAVVAERAGHSLARAKVRVGALRLVSQG